MAGKKIKAGVASLKQKLSADETEQSSKSKKSKVNNSVKSKKFVISETIGLSTLVSNDSSIIQTCVSRDSSESPCKDNATDCVLDEFNESNVSHVSTASQTSTPTHCLEEHELCISQDISLRASQLVDELMQLVDSDDEVIKSSCSQDTSKLITENSNSVSSSAGNEVDAYDQHYSKNKLCFTNSDHTPKDLPQSNSAAYLYGLSSKNVSNSDQKNSHISDDFSQVKADGMFKDKYGDNIKKACSNKCRIRVAQHNDESNSLLVSSSVDNHLNKTTDSQMGDGNETHEEIHLKPQLHVTVSNPLKQIINVPNKIMDKHTQKKVTLRGETNKQKQNLISDSCILSDFTANHSEIKCIKQNDSNDSTLTSVKDLKDSGFKSSTSNIIIALNNCVNNSNNLNISNINKKNTEIFKTSNVECDISVKEDTFVFANAALNLASEYIKGSNTGNAAGEPPSCSASKTWKFKTSNKMDKTDMAFAADRKIKIKFDDAKSNVDISEQIKFDFSQQKKIVENNLDLQKTRQKSINSCKFEHFTEPLRKKRLRSYSQVSAHAEMAKVIHLNKINSTKDAIFLRPSKKELKHRTIKLKKASFPPVPQPSSYPSLGEGPPAPPSTGKKYMGAHISAAGGIYKVFENARAIDAKSFAMFMRSQRKWAAKPFNEDDVLRYKEAAVDFPQHLILPHGSYLMNVGSCNNELLQKSRALLEEELQRCHTLGIPHFNFHPGSCVGGTSREDCCLTIAESINIAHSKVPDVIVVLENMCKQGNTIGGDFHELRLIIENVKDRRRVGVCLDTCHAHNAGYDLSTEEGFNSMILDFETIIGFQFLRGLHINDSKNEAGAHVDRHENIGKGRIGMDGMRRVLNCPHFNDMPLILETPYSDDAGYAKEIRMLEALVQQPGEEKKTKAKKASRTASKK